MKTLKLLITDPIGLYAKPASIAVAEANRYDSHIQMISQNKKVDMKSIIGVMYLAVTTNSIIEVIAEGPDEQEAIDGIKLALDQHNIAKEC